MNDSYRLHEPIVITVKHEVTQKDSEAQVFITIDAEHVQIGPMSIAVWAPPGKYPFAGVVIETRSVKAGDEMVVALTGAPVPFSDVLTVVAEPYQERSDEIADSVASWAEGLENRSVVATLFASHADDLEKSTGTVATAIAALATDRKKLVSQLNAASWEPFFAKINARTATMEPLDKLKVIQYWRSISTGLKR